MSPVNTGMTQVTYRVAGEDEPLRTMTLYGVSLWVDEAGALVAVDLPAGHVSTDVVA